jgi:prepilin-type N-terminal cleavage/methylation domain-containing protein
MKTELKAKFLQHLIQKKDKTEGFTLIELLVVIIIIGILSAIALPSFLNQANKARQSEAQTYVGSINRGQQAYFLEKSYFGSLGNLELGIRDSVNYTYATTPNADVDAQTTGTPKGTTMKGYAGRVYVGTGTDGNKTTLALLCEGSPGSVPTISGTVCP